MAVFVVVLTLAMLVAVLQARQRNHGGGETLGDLDVPGTPERDDRMPDWRPILAGPFLTALCWWVAYGVAGGRGVRGGDTTFAWLPLLTMAIALLWLLAVLALLAIRAILVRFRPHWWYIISTLSTAGNVIGVALIVGATVKTVSIADGWPTDPIAVGAAAVAGLLSLLPVFWIWIGRVSSPAWARV